jgi:bacillithiol biosynthesis cysteine-adding enzyme BshC
MQKAAYSFSEFSFGSKLIRDLISKSDAVKNFAGDFFSLAEMETKMSKRKSLALDRDLLVKELTNQNSKIEISDLTKNNIESLKDQNTFTITTGHQLNILTGPLFSIYKIAQVIVIAEDLKKRFPKYHFVPLFWMATEDHDFEEINHINLFNKKISWNKDHQESSIAGRIQTKSLQPFFEELSSLYQNDDLKNQIKELESIYLSSDNLATATRKLVNHLFGETGLVILDGDTKELKKLMLPVFNREISEQLVHTEVSATNSALEKSGYHQQVHVRECNLFFIHADGKRERIIFENNLFQFNNQSLAAADLIKLIEANPDFFSPNALLRPVYQELVLPNLVYVGGGGEIAYWLQLKSVFEKLNVSYPQLRVRDSVFILNQKQAEELAKSELKLEDLQKDTEEILKNLTLEKHGDTLNFSDAEAELFKAKSKILEKVNTIDNSLNSLVEAEFSKMISALEKIESKLVKSAKTKDESAKNRIVKLKEKLFPHNHFQERHENIINYYLTDKSIISSVLKTIQAEDEPKIRILIS